MRPLSYYQSHLEALVLVIVVVIAMSVAIGLFARLVLQLLAWRQQLRRKLVSLELTPPAFTSKSAYSNEQLFNALAGLRSSRTLKDKLLHRDVSLSLMITSSKSGGIRFLLRVDQRFASSVAQTVMSFVPAVKVREVVSQAPLQASAGVLEFKQTGEWYLPFAQYDNLEEHDPLNQLTGNMTKLKKEEVTGWQLVVTPVKIRSAPSVAYKILHNEELLTGTSHSQSILPKLTRVINMVLFDVLNLIGEVIHGSSGHGDSNAARGNYDQIQIAKHLKPARTLSKHEQELMSSIHQKVSQPLFRVSIRVMASMETPEATAARLAAFKSSLAAYNVPSYQGLRPRFHLQLIDRYRRFVYMHGLPALLKRHSCILSSSEVAGFYHFPATDNTKADNLMTSLSRTLPAPVSLKAGTPFDVVLGENLHHGVSTPIGLSAAERERHVYIIGGTGNGKTTMLQYALVQDMQSGKGLAVIDPHGDMAETMLRHVPKDRIKDVIYFNPDDIGYPIGLNLLELPEGLSEDELIREKDLVTESVISVFRKIFSDEDVGGHRIEYVLRNAIQTALTVPDATLFTVFDLLNDPKYRRTVLKTLDNKDLVNFWKNELNKAGEMQRVKMSAGITAKVGRFLFSASAKRILEQPKSTIDFDDIINSGKILICNFSKGLLGEDTSELFGITVLAKLQLASLRRARMPQNERRPFYLYVDEFQNFATASFVQMLSESRKYKLFMTMAEQSTSQQKDQQMVSVILANVGTVICFRTGNPYDERLMLPLFSSFVEEGEIANLSPFNFYARLSAVRTQEPLSGQTLLLSDAASEATAREVIEQSRKLHAIVKTEKDKAKPEVTEGNRSQTKPKARSARQVVPTT